MTEELSTSVDDILAGPLDVEDVQRLRLLASGDESVRAALHQAVERLAARPADDESAVLPLAAALYALGHAAEALPRFEQLKRTKVGSFFFACCAAEIRDYARAAELFEKAFQISSTLVEASWRRAEALAIAGDPNTRVALKELPDDPDKAADRRYIEGLCLESEGDIGAAIACYRENLSHAPNHPKTLFRLAYALDLAGEEKMAVTAYRQCIERCGPFVNALINLGVLYDDAARFDDAIRCFRQVTIVDPNNQRARLFLKDARESLDMYYDEEAERRQDKRNRVLEIPITDFELSVRSRNCLERINIRTLGDLTQVTERELLGYKNFGETSLNEVRAILAQKGLRLGQAVEDGAPGQVRESAEVEEVPHELLDKPIDELELSVRARRCMERLGIATIAMLVGRNEHDLLQCKNFGQTSMNEVKQKLEALGLSLRIE